MKEDRELAWSLERSARRYAGSLLDPEFDEEVFTEEPFDRLVFGEFDGDMKGRPERGARMGRTCEARRKRRTVPTDDPEQVTLPDTPPPGWAEP